MKIPVRSVSFLLFVVIAVSAAAQVPPDEDPVNISPQYYTVLFENDQVRVIEFRMRPGEKEPMHSHPKGVVRYLSDATFRSTLPDGTISVSSAKEGDVGWREYRSHALENIGTTEAIVFAVELKNAAD
jgi:quercetin dioxygenase-like cupin family protein